MNGRLQIGHSSLGGGVANSMFDSLEEADLVVVGVGGMMMLVSVRNHHFVVIKNAALRCEKHHM